MLRSLTADMQHSCAQELQAKAPWLQVHACCFNTRDSTLNGNTKPPGEHSHWRLLVKSGKKTSSHTRTPVAREAAGQTQGPENNARGDPRGQWEGQQPQAWSGGGGEYRS